MRVFKRAGAGVLALGVAVAGIVFTAPVASAHTGTLTTSAVCNDDGTYKITYTGTTTRVPPNGPGHTATLTVGEVQPAGSQITNLPATIVGNTTYTFDQIVPGTATRAQATAFLTWGDGSKADPIGKISLPGDCTSHNPTAPSGDLDTDCVYGGGHVAASHLDNGTAGSVTWRLVTGTNASHTTVVATQDQNGGLEANDLPDSTKVWLQYNAGQGWVDEGSVVTTGSCTPVNPTGSFTVVCTEAGADVTIATLDNGTRNNVVWTLTYGGQSRPVSSGDVVAVPGGSALALSYTLASGTTRTVQRDTAPMACSTPTGTVDKSSQPASGSVVSPGQAVTYTVTVQNTGTVRFENKPAVDTLPAHVSLVAGSITGGGTASADGRSITWSVSLDPQETATYTYGVTVDANAPPGTALLNRVVFLQDEATTTHEVGSRSLGIVKSVSPTGDAEFGDTLTYSLVVTAGGNLGQTNVVVSDYLPGYQPGRTSGTTTYVAGSAGCDAGTCTPVYDDTTKQISWALGAMAAGTSRTVTFQVTIDTPPADSDGGIPATTILNSGAVGSTETASTPSNEVQTPVTAVLGSKQGNKPNKPNKPNTPNQPTGVEGTSLPRTGSGQLSWTLGAAGAFLMLGSALLVAARKPKAARAR